MATLVETIRAYESREMVGWKELACETINRSPTIITLSV